MSPILLRPAALTAGVLPRVVPTERSLEKQLSGAQMRYSRPSSFDRHTVWAAYV